MLQNKINDLEEQIEELEQIKIQDMGQNEIVSILSEEKESLAEKDIIQLIEYFATPDS